MKKRSLILTALMLTVSVLTACSQTNTSTNNAQQSSVNVDQGTQLITPINQSSLQTNQGRGNSVPIDTSSYIGEDKAMQIALEHAGVQQQDLMFSNVKLDFDNGIWSYEVEFYAGNKEYDYTIDAASGTVLGFDYDAEGYFSPGTVQGTGTTGAVTIDTARQTALDQVPGATTDNIRIYADYDDGRMTYEGKIIYNTIEYEFTIDANTGTIIEWEAESIYN